MLVLTHARLSVCDLLNEMSPSLQASSNAKYAVYDMVPTTSSAKARIRYSICLTLVNQHATKKALT